MNVADDPLDNVCYGAQHALDKLLSHLEDKALGLCHPLIYLVLLLHHELVVLPGLVSWGLLQDKLYVEVGLIQFIEPLF